jgi:ABC-2 type transport system permease protein
MTALANHFAYEFKTGLRNSTLLLMNYLFPMAFYVMMGVVMTQINPGFQEVLLPAMVLFAAMASTLLGLPGPLVESREAGIYRSYKVNGVPAATILLTPALTTAFHVFIVAAIIALTGVPFFGGVAPLNWGAFILITLLSVLSFTGLGALIGVIAGDSHAVVLLSQLIFLPSMLLGGLMMPLDVLPESVRSISLFLPAAHAMEAYLGFAYGQATVVAPVLSVLALASSGLLAFGLAVFLFNWDSRNSARRGHPLLALLALVPYIIVVISQL